MSRAMASDRVLVGSMMQPIVALIGVCGGRDEGHDLPSPHQRDQRSMMRVGRCVRNVSIKHKTNEVHDDP